MGTVQMDYDVIVVGGSYSGMAAALQIARTRRSVLVIDAGVRRNRFADASHGFLGQDGNSPSAIASVARIQLLKYPNLVWREGTAIQAQADQSGFRVELEDGNRFYTKRLILATGVVDELPDIPGLQERWGKSVFHCPYCHGYELNAGRLGVIATGPLSLHQALLIPDWGPTTFFTNGMFEPDADQAASLQARGVPTEPQPIAAIEGGASVRLTDGRLVELEGLFTASRIRMASPLAGQLGCEFEEGPMGAFIRTDAFKETTVPNVFACGDAARAAGTVSLAVGDGALAGAATHQSLIFRR